MRKVISIALFGNVERYGAFLPTFALAHFHLFPLRDDWTLRIHADENIAKTRWGRFVSALNLAEVRWMPTAPLARAMLWRLEPLWDGFDYVFCRDLDAAPTPRDRACCDEFMVSGCDVHTVHDNRLHVGIMGGLSGFRSAGVRTFLRCPTRPDFHNLLSQYDGNGRLSWPHGMDQDFLNRTLLVPHGPPLLEHRFNGWHGGRAGAQPAHAANGYPMQAWSTPVPDKGPSGLLAAEHGPEADTLASHLGAAGYDIEVSKAFWKAHGDRNIVCQVLDCEEMTR